jgi:type IV pilus assembly protein PilN
MRFDINLASQPYQDARRFLWRWGVITLVVALVTGGLVCAATSAFFSWRVANSNIRSLQQQIDARNREKAEDETILGRAENRETRQRSQFLNALIARKAFSWTEVFTELEHIVPPRLRVLAIQPNVNEDNELELNLRVDSSSRDAAIELVRRLDQSSHFAHAVILSESLRTGQNQQQAGWQYDIRAIYIPSFARAKEPSSPISPPRSVQHSAAAPAGRTPAQSATEASNARH